MSGATRWEEDLRQALVLLGVEPADAARLAADSLAEARDAAVEPPLLYGPATVYARTLVGVLRHPPQDGGTARMPAGCLVLRLEAVTKRYRRRTVLAPVDLDLHAGEVAAVVGANGSGKSTLLRICAGLTRASSGRVERAGTVGYVPQEGGVVDLLTPAEHFELLGAAAGIERRRARAAGDHLATRLSWRPDPAVVAERLSGGTRQKLNLVLGELHSPDLLLLDEPYQGFDQGSYVNFWDQVYTWRDAGKAVLVVTHLLHELDRVDHVVDLGTGDRP